MAVKKNTTEKKVVPVVKPIVKPQMPKPVVREFECGECGEKVTNPQLHNQTHRQERMKKRMELMTEASKLMTQPTEFTEIVNGKKSERKMRI